MSLSLIDNEADRNWTKVNDDGTIVKRIISPGNDEAPKPLRNVHQVSIKYIGTLFPSKEEFDRSKFPFTFDLGRRKVIPAWEATVPTMRLGERCIMRCTSRYGYGSAGSKPLIPANAALQFDMELVKIEDRKLDPAEITMNLERERIRKIQIEREEIRALKEKEKQEAEERKKLQPDRIAMLKEKLANKNKKKGGRSR